MSIKDLKSLICTGAIYENLRGQDIYVAKDRTAFLAYAYLRSIPYRVVEPKCQPFFDKYGYDGNYIPKNIATVASKFGSNPVSESDIKAWLAVPESEARATKRMAAETKANALREQRRAEFMVALAKVRPLKVAV